MNVTFNSMSEVDLFLQPYKRIVVSDFGRQHLPRDPHSSSLLLLFVLLV